MEAVIDREKTIQSTVMFLENIFGQYHLCDFAVRLWDGTTWKASSHRRPRCTLVLNHSGALRRMFWPPNHVTLGEAYLHGDFDIEGDLEGGVALADCLTNLRWKISEKFRFGRYLLSLPASPREMAGYGGKPVKLRGLRHSRKRDAQAVNYHYDVSSDFYKAWLDKRMVYSCAFFHTPDDSLEDAQERKLDYICRKLRLQRGERLLDIGCGWGALILHAVSRYGVEAVGITLSRHQADIANELIREAGLADRCHVEVCDYRDVEEPYGFDKIASVGMFEHVGEARLPGYFQEVWRLLRPGGVFLNHGIAVSLANPLPGGPSFIDRYVFPDGELLPVTDSLRIAEMTGFEIRDLENLREHYILTLRSWIQRLEACKAEALRFVDNATYRIWLLYMAGSAYYFQTGRLNVFQALLAKPDGGNSKLPLTRNDWYEGQRIKDKGQRSRGSGQAPDS
jgi:cyclopropane-fatty-acyl-phospholipid synthase